MGGRVRYLESHFLVADDTAAVTDQLVKLMAAFQIGGKQVHDANIVASMPIEPVTTITARAD